MWINSLECTRIISVSQRIHFSKNFRESMPQTPQGKQWYHLLNSQPPTTSLHLPTHLWKSLHQFIYNAGPCTCKFTDSVVSYHQLQSDWQTYRYILQVCTTSKWRGGVLYAQMTVGDTMREGFRSFQVSILSNLSHFTLAICIVLLCMVGINYT